MPTIDLTGLPHPEVATAGTGLAAAPRRIGLSLPELRYAAGLAGDAPLPFDGADGPDPAAGPGAVDAMQSRLGRSPAVLADEAFRATLARLHDPAESLARRGLVVDGVLDAGLAGAIGLLAAPRIALDVDLGLAGVQAKVWHRMDHDAVASLATADGIAFELGWFATTAWPGELARVGAVSEEIALTASAVPAYVDLPFELVDAAAEAGLSGRGDLLPVLAARHHGAVRGEDGPLDDEAVVRILAALSGEARGRLRALVADVSGARVDTVGVVSWSLLADGWRSLRRHDDGEPRLEVRAATPDQLAAVLAPVLAPVLGEAAR